jgi:hypothetical protein
VWVLSLLGVWPTGEGGGGCRPLGGGNAIVGCHGAEVVPPMARDRARAVLSASRVVCLWRVLACGHGCDAYRKGSVARKFKQEGSCDTALLLGIGQ